ncbi:MAG TPA: PAS domain S-box protein [Flavobacteriales bacterium]|nr:PAS domain S-box protein [Flavobacteriales bacterium]
MKTQRLQILIVEDNTGDFLLIQQMLHEIRDFSKDIIHVTSLQDAIHSVQTSEPDVILLDLSLPDSYGFDSFQRLNGISPAIPILILSGLNDTRFAHEAVKNGAQDYLVKGEFEEKLLAKSILYSIERKLSMELIRQSQASYKLLFENNPIPMYIREKDGLRILKVNQSAIDHFGYSEEEFLKMQVSDLHPPEEVETLKRMIRERYGDYSTAEVFHHVCKDGKIVTVECRVQETELDGEVCYLVLADDVTEKRHVQEEMLFQSGVLKNVRDTIFVTDRKGIITYWNEGAELSFGYSRDEIVGRNFDVLYAEVDKLNVRAEQHEILAGRITQWETRLITKDDKIVWSDIKASHLYDENGMIVGIIRVCKDITQSRYFSEKQKETVAMLNSIFNNVNQSIVLLDQSQRIKAFNVIANRQNIQLMGQELKENIPFSDYLLADVQDSFRAKFEESMLDKQVQWEMAYRFSATSVHWYSISLSPVSDEKQNVLGACVSMMNITERKMADEKFRGQFLEIENNNKELDRLVKILSHDLKAPMNSVSGLITLAREEKNPEEFGNYLDMMEKSLKKLETFTNDIIASLRSRGQVVAVKVDLFEQVQDVMDELRFVPGAETIRFVNEIGPNVNLNSDPARLRVILSNLISNAIKYSDPSKLDCFVKVTCKEYPLLLEIEVEDNGIGIAAEHHKRIFDSYYKLSDRSDSNGLGLSNVKDAVQKLQGTIEVESTLGLGSIFKIQLPAI